MEMPPRSKAFCVTLPDSSRRGQAQFEFDRIGMPVQFWNGINGVTFGLKTFLPAHHDWFTGPRIIGINLAHWILWRCIEFLDYDIFMVFEDDVGFHPQFDTLWATMMAQLPADWQMCYIGACCIKNNPFKPVSDNIIVAKNPMATHAYMFKKEIVGIMIDGCASARNPIDQEIVFSVLPKVRHYTMRPSLATQQGNECFKDSNWTF